MASEHDIITDPEIHEPKGVAAASATQTYVADGAGSGSWRKMGGWANYSDSGFTSGSPLAILSGVRTQLTVNGLGASTDETRLPGIWDEVSNTIDGSAVAAGDAYDFRLIFKCQAGGTGNDILIDIDIGGGIGIILSHSTPLLKTAGATNDIVLSVPLFVGSTFVSNSATIYFTPSANMDFWDISMLMVKTYSD